MKISNLFLVLVILVFLLIFKFWFLPITLSNGDWGYRFIQTINQFPIYPYAWDANFSNGVGGNIIFLLPLNTYSLATSVIFVKFLDVPWEITEKIIWFIPFLLISSIGAYRFFRKFFTDESFPSLFSSIVFTTNSYCLMLVGGGQIGVGMGYAFIPWIFYSFIDIFENNNDKDIFKKSIIAGLVFSLQLAFDLRIAYVTLAFVGLYYLFSISKKPIDLIKKTIVYFGVIPGVVTVLLNFFWLLPFILVRQNPLETLGDAYTSTGVVKFLSFAKFENTISLLHPNWPDNIFGKEYFMRPEFLLIPIIAFTCLILLKRTEKNKNLLIIFSTFSIVAAFLAKGSSDPFGDVYIWAFSHIPGFVMFRDSTKWYGIIALSYCILIPYSIDAVSRIKILSQQRNKTLIFAAFLLLWTFIIRQAVLGQLSGTFKQGYVPDDYSRFAQDIDSQHDFFRTLWIPNFSSFSYYSTTHPIIGAADFYSKYSNPEIVKKIVDDKQNLMDRSIKYIVVPDDTFGKIFVNDHRFDKKLYTSLVKDLKKITWLKYSESFGDIVVFEINGVKDHFWGSDKNTSIQYQYVSPVEYKVDLNNIVKGDRVVFTDHFDGNWIAKGSDFSVSSIPFGNKMNSFVMPASGSYSVTIYYKPQDYVNFGLIASGLSLLAIVGIIFRKNK